MIFSFILFSNIILLTNAAHVVVKHSRRRSSRESVTQNSQSLVPSLHSSALRQKLNFMFLLRLFFTPLIFLFESSFKLT